MTGLPGQLAALARHVTGEIAEVADRSWQREGSAVWEIADAAGGCWVRQTALIRALPSARGGGLPALDRRAWTGPGTRSRRRRQPDAGHRDQRPARPDRTKPAPG